MIVLDFIYNEELYTSFNRLVYIYNEVKFYCQVAKLIHESDAFCENFVLVEWKSIRCEKVDRRSMKSWVFKVKFWFLNFYSRICYPYVLFSVVLLSSGLWSSVYFNSFNIIITRANFPLNEFKLGANTQLATK